MDIFSKYKILLRLVIALILLNLFSVGYLWISKKSERNPRPPKQDKENITAALRDKLNLTREQAEEFTRVREDFFKKEDELSKGIKNQRDSLNIEMFREKDDTAKLIKLAHHLAGMELQMELYRIEQAQQLKALCTKEQLIKFQDLVIDIRDYLQPKKLPDIKPPRPK